MKKLMVVASALFLTGALTACNADDNEALDTRDANDTRPIGYYSNENMNNGDRGEGPLTQIADRDDGGNNLVGRNGGNDGNGAQINYADGYEGDLAQRISRKVNKMDNVEDARVIINNDAVIVGIDTSDQNDRNVKEQVRKEVQEITNKNVRVTTDEEMFTRIRNVDDDLRNGNGFDEVRSDFTGIMNDLGDAAQRPFENNR
ncbi:YhcN/YlaJ family sporulation lipoprotein [Alkalihalobacillus sp. AL-G]|uniref:YhcN/YlaJ family sporulation lipoprotein n=1 Tax=Alkalihalobacillus sp. AL-G TaxID=2926399 RepID=UPI00272D2682|nr:YhcN/YlaJ family sporulation lipoprotein [Alkalihalobacillus sp. AL-G]WLD92225.1 YhcN/YlaJ family sporulation lipoprotein [Alkalihalobacillus sp. AL-G]